MRTSGADRLDRTVEDDLVPGDLVVLGFEQLGFDLLRSVTGREI